MPAIPTKRPRRASLNEVQITHDGETAIIEHADPTVPVAHVRIDPENYATRPRPRTSFGRPSAFTFACDDRLSEELSIEVRDPRWIV